MDAWSRLQLVTQNWSSSEIVKIQLEVSAAMTVLSKVCLGLGLYMRRSAVLEFVVKEFLEDTVDIQTDGDVWMVEEAHLYIYTAEESLRNEYWEVFVGSLVASKFPALQAETIDCLVRSQYKRVRENLDAFRA